METTLAPLACCLLVLSFAVVQTQNQSLTTSTEKPVTVLSNSNVDTTEYASRKPNSDTYHTTAANEKTSHLQTSQPATTLSSQPATTLSSQPATTLSSQPATTLSSQPATTLSSQPETTLSSQPATTLSSQPATTLSSQPATTLSSQPETTLSSQPETTLSSQPQTTLSSQPQTTLTSQPATYSSSQPATNSSSEPDSTSLQTPSIQTTTFPETTHTIDPTPDTSVSPTENSTQTVLTTMDSASRTTKGWSLDVSEQNLTIIFSVMLGLFVLTLVGITLQKCRHRIQYVHQPLNNTSESDGFAVDDDTLVISGGLYDGHPIYDNVPPAPSEPSQFRLEFLH